MKVTRGAIQKSNWFVILLLVAASLALVRCGGSDSDSGGAANTGPGPALTAADFPSVSPCSDRDTAPDDAAFVAALAAAAELRYRHFMYDGDDTLGKVCGKQGEWNPAEVTGVSERLETVTLANIADMFTNFSVSNDPSICRTGFGFEVGSSFDDGFPAAGIYRSEFCVNDGQGNSYRVRTRWTVSGDNADQTLTTAGVTRADLEICDATGSEVTSEAELKDLIDSSGTFTVSSNDCATDHLEVAVEILCVKLVPGETCP